MHDFSWFKNARTVLITGIFIFFIFILEITISHFYVRTTTMQRTENTLQKLIQRIKSDLRFENGKWNTSFYNADPDTPHPTGSSGFLNPLYIITRDGFVIERNQPIHGLLDSSDFKRLITFQKPQTITTVTNETWRVLSQPILAENIPIGVIMVSYYNPLPESFSAIDSKLQENLQQISSTIQISHNQINLAAFDIRNIPYDVSFEIVNQYNKVLINNGRTPTFVDPSYVDTQLHALPKAYVTDTKTGEQFYVLTSPLIDAQKNTIGIIVAGNSLASLYDFLYYYPRISSFIALLFTFPLTILALFLMHTLQKRKVIQRIIPNKITFNKIESFLQFDKKIIAIPYATHQYYLCEAIFSNPRKRWEIDELLKKFGEEVTPSNWRKVYDAMIMINKKVFPMLQTKLIINREKTYQLNPELLPKIM